MMKHSAKILADTHSRYGERLTTLEVTFPRIVLSEFNTHRVFSRNSASSRAIPVEKMLKMVKDNPYIPTHWGKNQKGMQAEECLSDYEQFCSEKTWLQARDYAVEQAEKLLSIGVHKQITNRLLEPFMWHTVIVTATEWENWTHLRDNKDAHPEIALLASLMKAELDKSTMHDASSTSHMTGWHLPLVTSDEIFDFKVQNHRMSDAEIASTFKKVSVGRCARISYLTHEGKRDITADIALHDRLLTSGHMSPFEHVARPMRDVERLYTRRFTVHMSDGTTLRDVTLPVCANGTVIDWDSALVLPPGVTISNVEETHFCGNFNGFIQYRKEIPGEWDILSTRAAK